MAVLLLYLAVFYQNGYYNIYFQGGWRGREGGGGLFCKRFRRTKRGILKRIATPLSPKALPTVLDVTGEYSRSWTYII